SFFASGSAADIRLCRRISVCLIPLLAYSRSRVFLALRGRFRCLDEAQLSARLEIRCGGFARAACRGVAVGGGFMGFPSPPRRCSLLSECQSSTLRISAYARH